MAHASLLRCHEELKQPPETIIIRGKLEEIQTWQHQCQLKFNPSRTIYAIPDDTNNLAEGLKAKCSQDNNKAIAYVCRGTQCQAPLESLDSLEQELRLKK